MAVKNKLSVTLPTNPFTLET